LINLEKRRFRLLAVRQIDETLRELKPLTTVPRPLPGWVAAIRKTLGMNSSQLAERMGISQASAAKIESGEVTGKATLESLQRAAEALGCRLVYGLVPNESLEELLQKQATDVARAEAEYVNHHMTLEDQRITDERVKQMIEDGVAELLDGPPHVLWKKPR
jgi:predicted DNA-binding mobile mystery protein A